MDYRPLEGRSKLAVELKKTFYPAVSWGAASLKIASLIAKLCHEAAKCWPSLPEHEAVDKMISTFSREDLIEAVLVEDTREKPKGKIRPAMELPSAIKVMKELTQQHKECADAGQGRLEVKP